MFSSENVNRPPRLFPRESNIFKLFLALPILATPLMAFAFYSNQTKTVINPMPTQLSYLGSGAPSRQILGVVAPEARAKNLPDRLRIPKIRVDTAVQQVGLTLDGAMDIPTNSVDVGWFKEGAAPGESGSAVVDGHLDSRDGSPGVFVNLRDLRIGDKVYVRNKSGLETTFVVWQTKTYEPDAQPAEVFNVSDGVHLNLITCTGTWNFGKQNYGQRLVVFTTIEKKAVN